MHILDLGIYNLLEMFMFLNYMSILTSIKRSRIDLKTGLLTYELREGQEYKVGGKDEFERYLMKS